MKIRKFNKSTEPESGDYVICYDSQDELISKFVENHVGEIVEIDTYERYPYTVLFDEVLPKSQSYKRTFSIVVD